MGDDDVSAGLALDVAAAEVLALASLEYLLGPGHVAPAAAQMLTAVVAGARAVALPVKNNCNFLFFFILYCVLLF